MSVALIFGGQGEEREQMGLALAERFPEAQRLLDHASSVIGLDAKRLLMRGGRALSQTAVLQPLLTAVSLGAFAAFRARGLDGACVLGHSLGELAGWSAAGAFSADEAIGLARQRGLAMEAASAARPGGMCSLRATDRHALADALRCARTAGFADLAADLGGGHFVISGAREAISALRTWPDGSTPLRVGGAWHSRAMDPARVALAPAFSALATRRARLPVITNDRGWIASLDGAAYHLERQLTRPVRLAQALETLRENDVRHCVTFGPANSLRVHLRRALGPSVRFHRVEDPRDLQVLEGALVDTAVQHVG